MKNSVKINAPCAIIMALSLFLSITLLGITPATAMERSCPELGTHQNITNKRAVFVPGNVPKTWLDPGAHYNVGGHKQVTVSSSVSGSIDAQFLSFVKANVAGNIGQSYTLNFTQSWSWTNNTNQKKWVQLGAHGYEFDYSKYTVVSPCRIINSTKKHAIMPTNEPWLHHN